MVFSSIEFIIFFMVVITMLLIVEAIFRNKEHCYIKNKIRIKQTILLIASYIFYGWWDWRFCFLMFGLTVVAYISSIKIYKNKNIKFYKGLGVLFPLIVLGIFKYFNFFMESFTNLFGITNKLTLKIILPVGISFFTFQTLSYVIDVSNKKIKPCTSFTKLALYISFFPQLVAGPIVKASYFLPQLDDDKKITWVGFNDGIQIFMFGIIKKMVFADTLAIFVDQVFNFPRNFSGLTIILAIISYSIQIYYDFSGYSDMAVGISKILGYDLPRNFNLPYVSKNITEFWKRWHISLSSWLQEYLYFPLGGNRKGEFRTYINLMITMIIGGLWHGASWTFIIWGILHGLALCIHKYYNKYISKKIKIPTIISIIITYIFVCICWIFFRCDSFSQAYYIFEGLLSWDKGITHIFTPAILSIICMLLSIYIAMKKSRLLDMKSIEGFYPILDLSTVKSMTIFFIILGLTLGLIYTGSSPFIYFQF